jgi:predicted HicB family RNase H-like nuclease
VSKPKKRRAGRPRLPNLMRSSGMLRVRVKPDVLRAIESKAREAKQSVSEWIRSTIEAAIQG